MPKKLTLAEATSKARQNSKLNSLDNFGSGKDLYKYQLTAIQSAIAKFIQRVKKNIQSEDMIVTGEIENISIEEFENGVNVLAPAHLIYQDKGVNGAKKKLYQSPFSYKNKKPPVEPFIHWVEKRGLADGKEAESFAYAIREKQFQEGIEPKKIYSKEIPKLIEDLSKEIAGFTAQGVTETFARKK